MLKNIHIALPAYTRQIYADTFQSLVSEMLYAAGRGYNMNFDQICGASDIPALRNAFLSRFMHGEAEKLVFIDTDLAWDVGAICKLIEHEQDFVVGGYRFRSEPEKYPIHWLPGPIRKRNPATGEIVDDDDPKGLVEVRAAPGGMTCLSRAAVQRMMDAYPKLKYNDFLSTTGHSWGLFDNFHKDQVRWSEDLAFCLRWREIGGKIWMDIDLQTYHIGPNAFPGNVKNWLIAQHEKKHAEARVAA